MTSNQFRLNHSVLGYPRTTGVNSEPIPMGSEITVIAWDHDEASSLITCDGNEFLVDKSSLPNFLDPA